MDDNDSGPIENRSPRHRLHHSIRHTFSGAIARYYRKHPEKLQDPNLEEGIDTLMKIMQEVLDDIDKFDINDRPQ